MSQLKRISDYWFRPYEVKFISIARIVIIGYSLIIILFEWLFANINITITSGHTNPEYQKWLTTIEPSEYEPMVILKIMFSPFGWDFRPDPWFIDLIWLAAIIFGILSLVGLYTRLSLIIYAIANTFLIAHAYSYKEYHHPEAIMILFIWILVFGYNKKSWSLDKLRKRKSKLVVGMTNNYFEKNKFDDFARWPLLLMQWIFVLIYFSSGLEKLFRSGFHWLNGHTLAYSFAQDGILHGHSLGVLVAGFPTIFLQFASLFAILFETTFIFAVLFPRIAWVYVSCALAFHTSSFILQATPFIFYYPPLFIVFLEPILTTFKKINIKF